MKSTTTTVSILSKEEFEKELVNQVSSSIDSSYEEYLKNETLKNLHTDLNFNTVEDLIAKLLEVNNITSYSNKQSQHKRETVNAGSSVKIRQHALDGKTVKETLDIMKQEYPNLRYQNVRQVYVQLETKGADVRMK